jgi:MacB-like periplasmic core domain
MHMLRGRTFNDRDTAAATPVVIITETMAKRYWPKGDALRDRLLIGKGVMPQLELEQPRQIIGIVGDVRDGALNQNPGPEMYLPNAQVPVQRRIAMSDAQYRNWRYRLSLMDMVDWGLSLSTEK